MQSSRLAATSWLVFVIFSIPICGASGEEAKVDKKILPKDPLYISDIDLENLYDQWEDSDDDKLPPDELPAHKKPPKKQPNLSPDDWNDPEKLIRQSKRGQTVMAFVDVANNPSKGETELITERWHVGLTNAHIKCQRFVISDSRAIFVFEDGSQAFESREFFLDQPELKEFTIENQSWQGRGYPTETPYPDQTMRPTKPPITTRRPAHTEL